MPLRLLGLTALLALAGCDAATPTSPAESAFVGSWVSTLPVPPADGYTTATVELYNLNEWDGFLSGRGRATLWRCQLDECAPVCQTSGPVAGTAEAGVLTVTRIGPEGGSGAEGVTASFTAGRVIEGRLVGTVAIASASGAACAFQADAVLDRVD